MDTFFQDVRYALRNLRRAPGFAAVALLTLGLGIGATTAIFSVVRAVLMAPLPYDRAEQVVEIWSRWVDFDKTWLSDAEIVDDQGMTGTFQSVAAWGSDEANLTGDGEPLRIGVGQATANLFATLGAPLALGRSFTAAEDAPGGPPVVVLGWGLWQRRWGGDPGVLGRAVELDGVARRVVGVARQGFALPTDFGEDAAHPSQAWIPLQIDPAHLTRSSHGYYAAGRLAPGVTPEAASAALAAWAAALTERGDYPREMRFEPFAVPVDREVRGTARRALSLVFGAVGFLLLIACANVANLLLARAEGRQREIAVRAAIGGGRARLARQLLTESFVLAASGAALGVGLAWVGVRLIAARGAAGLPALAPIGLDLSVLAFAAGLSVLTTFLAGIAPALRAMRLDLVESLREGGAGATVGVARLRLRGSLATLQMALAVVLLLGAGLMLRSLAALDRVDLGFDPRHVLTAQLRPPEASYDSAEKVVAFDRALLERVRGLPGVESAGLVRRLPLDGAIGDWGLAVEGYEPGPGRHAKGDWQVISDGGIEALGERLVAGRPFTAADDERSQPVALVNQTLARTYWPGLDPVGRRLRMGSSNPDRPWLTVVGVVADVRHNGVTALIKEKFYVPAAQFHLSTGFAARNMALVVRSGGDPLALATPIREAIRALDPDLPVANVRPLTTVVAASLATPRLTGSLLSLFALLALFLAAVGIFGVLAYLVTRRRREIGIRMALGASGREILRLVVARGLSMAAVGIAAGLAGAFFLTGLMASLLWGVAPRDPATFAAVTLLLLAVALAASALPALRAARVDPLVALKTE